MKAILKIVAVGFMTTLLASCGPEPTNANRNFTGMSGGGTPVPAGKALPVATIYCTTSGNNCGDWVGSGDVVIYNRQSELYNGFITDYNRDSLSHFFRVNNWRDFFSAVDKDARISQDVIDKIVSKEYTVQVALDSSIIIFNNSRMLTPSNVFFAIKRK